MTRQTFFEHFQIGELYMVRGTLVQLTGYDSVMDQGVFEDDSGNEVVAGPGLIRKVNWAKM